MWTTFYIFVQDIIDDGINVFVDIFEEKRKSVFDGQLELLEKVRIVEGANLAGKSRFWQGQKDLGSN